MSAMVDERWLVAVAINVLLGALAVRLGGLDRAGSLAGMVLGTALYVSLGPAGYLMLVTFYGLGTGATRLGFASKQGRGLSQPHGGRRSVRHVIANAGVAVACAVLAALLPGGEVARGAFAAALAAATGDTLASEIGQLVGGPTHLITGFAPVEPGTEGGVSLVGTAAGVVGATAIAALGTALGLYGSEIVPIVAVAGVAGVSVDSVMGATLERAGVMGNEAVNFVATLAAALVAAGLAWGVPELFTGR